MILLNVSESVKILFHIIVYLCKQIVNPIQTGGGGGLTPPKN